MADFEIRSDPLPPAPPRKGRSKGVSKYPMAELEVGQNIIVKGVKKGTVATMIMKAGKTLGRKFVVRAVPGGWGVWRIAPKVKTAVEDDED